MIQTEGSPWSHSPKFHLETRETPGLLLKDCDGGALMCQRCTPQGFLGAVFSVRSGQNAKIVALKCCSVAACEG